MNNKKTNIKPSSNDNGMNRYTLISKKSLGLVIAIGAILIAGGGAAAGYFAYKASQSNIPNNHEIILDPTVIGDATISEITTTSEGNKVGTVTSTTKKIVTVKVSIGTNLLVEDTDYKLEAINGDINGFKVTVYVSAINKYAGAISLAPKFEETPTSEYCIVQFDTDGGSKVDTIKVVKGEKATRPSDPTKTDYTFGGWYYKNDSGVEVDFNFEETPIETHMILYARWNLPVFEGLNYYYDVGTNGYFATSEDCIEKIPARFSIPSAYNNLPVTGIAEDAFEDATGIVEINLPNTIKVIKAGAFYDCPCLQKINIPSSCIKIEDSAFNACTALCDIKFSEGLEYIGEGVFEECYALTKVVLPDSLLEIGQGIFGKCESLTSVHLGNNLNSIPEGAFYDCVNLTELNIPTSIKSFGEECLVNCENLITVEFGDEYSNWYTNNDPKQCVSVKELIPILIKDRSSFEKITCISDTGQYLLQYIGDDESGNHLCYVSILKAIQVMEISPTISTKIGEIEYTFNVVGLADKAFYKSEIIKEVTLPSSITYLGDYAFAKSSISIVNFKDSNDVNLKSIGKYCFADCKELKLFNNKDEFEIYLPEGLEKIGDLAFAGLTLGKVHLPSSLKIMSCEETTYINDEDENGEDTLINSNPFTATVLSQLDIDESNTVFSSDEKGLYLKSNTDKDITKETLVLAFFINEEDYVVSEGVHKLGRFCFDTYRHLRGTEMGVPCIDNLNTSEDLELEYVDSFNFTYVNKFSISSENKSFVYDSTNDVLLNYDKSIIYHCFNSELDSYVVPDTVEEISDYAFYKVNTDFNITLNSGLKSIGNFAFAYCSIEGSETFKIPSSIESLGFETFNSFGEDVKILIDSEYVINLKDGYSYVFEGSHIYVNADLVSKIKEISYISFFMEVDKDAEEVPGYTAYKHKEY